MSSHREAPEIAKDPVADNTDVYAFVSTDPGQEHTVTMIANFVPLQGPAGGPNFYEFGDDVLYEIHIDNDGDARADVTYQFRFQTEVRNPDSFLYNTGTIKSIGDKTWNRPQFYSVARVVGAHRNGEDDEQKDDEGGNVLGSHLACPPCNIGPRSTPKYEALAAEAIHHLGGGVTVFAGQRSEGFYVDLGSIFDLLTLRPVASAHVIPAPPSGPGVNATKDLNIQSIVIRVPRTDLTRAGHNPTNPADERSTVGIWSSASRRRVTIRERNGRRSEAGPWVQVSRLVNPLFNEVIVPMGDKDRWTRSRRDDQQFLKYVQHPEVSQLLPALYPAATFAKLRALDASGEVRTDMIAILLNGIKPGVVPTFPGNFTGPVFADLLRLNLAIPPTSGGGNRLGVVAGDNAGFPNGRRVSDDGSPSR